MSAPRLRPAPRLLLLLSAVSLLVAAPALGERPGRVATLRAAPDGTGEDLLTLEIPAVRWETAESGRVVPVLPDFGRLGAIGLPDVPARRERVALPPRGELVVRGVRVEWAEGVIPGVLASFPAANPDAAGPAPEGFWPESPVRVAVPDGALRHIRFASLEIRPLQVDVGSGRFRVARRIEIRVDRGESLSATPFAAPAGASPFEAALPYSAIHGADRTEMTPLGGGGGGGGVDGQGGAATFPAFKLGVDDEGLHEITYAWAQANEPGLFSFLTGNDPRQLALFVQGTEVPILVNGEGDGVFGPGDSLVFYGQPLTGVDPYADDVWQDGDYTDVNVYRLELKTTPLRVGAAPGTRAPTSGYAVPADFPHTVRHEEDARFQGFVPSDGDDHWFVDPFIISPECIDTTMATCSFPVSSSLCGSSCMGMNDQCCAASVDQTVDTPGHAGGQVDLRVALMGIRGTTYHRSDVVLDGTLVGTADWDGFVRFTHGVDDGPLSTTPPSPLGATTSVTVRLPMGRLDGMGQAVTADWVGYDYVEIDYDRLYQSVADALQFTVTNANREVRVSGFSGQAEVWDTSQSSVSSAGMSIVAPRRVQGVTMNGSEARFEVDADGGAPDPRPFAAAGPGGFLVPASVAEDVPPSDLDVALGSTLMSGSLGADWLVIGHRSLIDLTPGSRLDQLLTHRQGQGLSTLVVDVEDVYDDFTHGIVDPQAIKDFVQYALGNWTPAPSFLVLLGDSSWDHKNNYGNTPPRQLVPTYMYDLSANPQFAHHPSDTWFAAVVGGDELPDAVVSRIPAHDLAEAEEVFRKLVAYETAGDPASVTGRALLVSEWDLDVANSFFRVHDEVYNDWFASGPATGVKIYEDDPSIAGCSTTAANQNASIDTNVNANSGIITFAGHGGFKNWGKGCSFFATDFPSADDFVDINLDSALLFTVHANCITGNHAATSSTTSSNDSWYSFVEDGLLETRKGFVGGLAPSHLSFTFELDSILDSFYGEVFGKRKERLVGNVETAMRLEFDSLNNQVLVRSYMLEGDPATVLSVPAPEHPTITSVATAGSGELQVSWNPPADTSDVATYRVYRSLNPTANYGVAGETTGSSFLDTGLTDCTDYYYYVVSVDGDGFESRWSNFNETCFGSMSDCETGSPENPTAPSAPALLDVQDTLDGGRLRVIWDTVGAPGDLTNWVVEWGTTMGGPYTGLQKVAPSKDRTDIIGLVDGTTYYVVVHGENCTQTGPASNELSGVPHLVRGRNPPKSIGDLMVEKVDDPGDGALDAKLTWSVPTQSAWGVGTSVASIEVYASSAGPAFATDVSTLLTNPALAGTATEYTHDLQPADPPNWFYLVAAVDTSGERSATGVELPAAVEDLMLTKNGGNIDFTWTAVTTTMNSPPDGERELHIAGYNLYGRNSVLSRTDTGPSNVLQQGIAGTATSLATPPDTLFTYQLLAEDGHGNESVW